MSAGPSYGFPSSLKAVPIPNADPDEFRRLLQQMPFDPSQPASTMNVEARPGPAVAMDEAETQRLEQATGVQPAGASPQHSRLVELFGGAPMGPAQSFSGTSGTIIPSLDAGLQGSPLPPTRPGAADLAAPVPLSFGRPPQRATAPSPQADAPAPGAVPAMGQAPAGLTAPAGAAPNSGPPAPEGPSFVDRLMGGIRKTDGLLASVGAGLMSTPGFGEGVAAGLKAHQAGEGQRSVSRLAEAKATREAASLTANQSLIRSAFPNLTAEQIAAGGGNSNLVSAAIAKLQNPNAGRDMKADSSGVNRWVDTGESVFKNDEGKTKWTQAHTPDGGTILYDESDPTKNQMLVPGQTVRAATPEELRAFGIQPGQAVKMTAKDGPVPIGGVAQPHVREFEQPDGSKVARVQNPETGAWEAPNFGASPPSAQAPANPYATGKFNEGQGKAAGFSDRMMGSEQILRGLESVNQGMLRGTVEGALPNGWKTEDRQKLEQAQRDFVNAQLRRESGAAISPSEFTNAEKQYFPQPGDADAVVAQKRVNRQRAVEAMGRESGPAYAPSKKFDDKGGIVPSTTPDARFKQLRGAGLSKEDAYARMHTEGY